jgi:choline-sulfatase
VRRAYYALVTYVDRKVGQLLASLEENGFAENTLVVFCSDHGDMLCEKGMVQKRTFYEWSSRVPLIIRFPDGSHAGVRRPEPVNLIDILPTLLDVVDYPQDKRLDMDGRSLIGLLDGSDTQDWITFSEYHSQGSHAPCFMVREEKYKYVYIHGYDQQLFDLEADPGEWHNLAEEPGYEGIVETLKGRILERFDPAAIEAVVQASVENRWLLKRAMQITKTRWDVEPRYDPHKSVLEAYLEP